MANKTHKSFFMPMLCRFSLNDTVKPTRLPESSSHDPSSPKLSCTGQIKKRSTNNDNNNNNTRFMASRLSASTNSRSSIHYTKLYKLLSGKNLISPAIDSTFINNPNKCVAKRSKSCNDRARIPISTENHSVTSSIVVAQELDPPLPVVKYDGRDKKVNVNLCKRRGLEMKTLQIQPIQVTIDRNIDTNINNAGFLLETSATTF